MDADSFIRPYQTAYRFPMLPQFWDFLQQKAQEGIIASPQIVLDLELSSDKDDPQDELAKWAKPLKGVMFLEASQTVQASYSEVVQYVQGNTRYKQFWVEAFLAKADPWVIAYAKALGGRIVGFETPQPEAKKPKLPDVADHFHIKCINLWDMLAELGWSVGTTN